MLSDKNEKFSSERRENMVNEMAKDFSASVLNEIADEAGHRAQLIVELEPKPWRRSEEQSDAIDTFRQLAAYARRVVAMQNQ